MPVFDEHSQTLAEFEQADKKTKMKKEKRGNKTLFSKYFAVGKQLAIWQALINERDRDRDHRGFYFVLQQL